MKRVLTIIIGTLALSAICFAGIKGQQEDNIEGIMAKNFSTFKDGVTTVQVKDLDVDIEGFKTKIDVELYEGSENTSLKALQIYAKDLADIVRKEIGNENKVLIEIEVDRTLPLGDKKLLVGDF